MSIAESLLPEFDLEMANLRKILEIVPDGLGDWRPHPKSMTLGFMAVHLAQLPEWVTMTLTRDELDFGATDGTKFTLPAFEDSKRNVEVFDEHVKKARAVISETPDPEFFKPWSLKTGGKVLFTMPRIAVLRGMVMNHMIHHRAQMTVYLRLNDVPLPSLYGPTADNPM